MFNFSNSAAKAKTSTVGFADDGADFSATGKGNSPTLMGNFEDFSSAEKTIIKPQRSILRTMPQTMAQRQNNYMGEKFSTLP